MIDALMQFAVSLLEACRDMLPSAAILGEGLRHSGMSGVISTVIARDFSCLVI